MAPRTPTQDTAVVLVAAGASTRMGAGSGVRKPFLVLDGRTVLEHAARAFDVLERVREIVLVGHPDDLERLEALARTSTSLRKVRRVVAGGELRVDSVRAGVGALDDESELVAVHDAARPLVPSTIVARALATAAERGAALVATPVVDTIKTSSDGLVAESTLDRSVLWAAQTPQVFRLATLRALLERARREAFRPTDDAALHERYVGPVPIVACDATNLKITTPEDLLLAASLLRSRNGA